MRLDPRSPLVVNTHELGRRPGMMRELALSAPAPADLAIELIGVPTASPVELQLRLESVMEGVLVSGAATVVLLGECSRCLGTVEDQLEVPLQELYLYPERAGDEDEAARLDGELLDLEPVLRDAVVLALPFQPVCRPDCPGLCSECGVALAESPGHTHGDEVDPRWAALVGLPNDRSAAPAVDADDKE
jgi:uncharacterized protein